MSNVRKDAPDADVSMVVCWERSQVRLEVEDTGLPVTVGGRLEAGPTERGFRIELRLPVSPETPSRPPSAERPTAR
jgi:hypothetical protein